jgi:hypothetical protein
MMTRPFYLSVLLRNIAPAVCAVLTLALCGLTTGCAAQKPVDQATLAELQIDADVTDPTAEALHDLAGQLLMYEAVHHKLPATLAELKRGDGLLAAVDPASNLPFVYTPDSARQPKLPGRIVICQPRDQGPAGRWALLLNDLGNQGKVITYVQRVPESMIPKAKDGHPTFHQTLP